MFCWEDLKHGCYQLKATYLDLHSKVYKNQLTVHFLIALISHLKISNMTAVFFIILASYFRSEIPNSLNSQYACCQLIEKTNFHRYFQQLLLTYSIRFWIDCNPFHATILFIYPLKISYILYYIFLMFSGGTRKSPLT